MFNDRLKELRSERKISQAELAEMVCVSRNTISSIELGQSKPSFDTLIALADCFNVSLDYLVGRTEEETIGYERVGCDNCDESVICK